MTTLFFLGIPVKKKNTVENYYVKCAGGDAEVSHTQHPGNIGNQLVCAE